jgi:hypothetical protein
MIIDLTYFDGAISLSVLGNEAAINQAIQTYQEQYLRKVMGESLFLVFLSEAGAGSGFSSGFSSGFGGGGAVIPARWTWVLDGKTYTHNGYTHIFKGIRTAVAEFVYWNYRKYVTTSTLSSGEASGKSENADTVSADPKMIAAWNDMARSSRYLAHMLEYLKDSNDADVYPEWDRYEADEAVYKFQNPYGI